mgnify:FL=1
MGNINIGNQNILFNYKKLITSLGYSKIFKNIYKEGIYDGLTVDSISSNSISILSGSVIIKNEINSIYEYFKIDFLNNFQIAITQEDKDNNRNILIISYDYNTDNYADVKFVDNKTNNMIEICRVNFNTNEINYTYRDDGKFNFRNFFNICGINDICNIKNNWYFEYDIYRKNNNTNYFIPYIVNYLGNTGSSVGEYIIDTLINGFNYDNSISLISIDKDNNNKFISINESSKIYSFIKFNNPDYNVGYNIVDSSYCNKPFRLIVIRFKES